MQRLASLLVVDAGVEGRVRARLAVGAILMADSRSEALGGTPAARRAAALHVAHELVDSS